MQPINQFVMGNEACAIVVEPEQIRQLFERPFGPWAPRFAGDLVAFDSNVGGRYAFGRSGSPPGVLSASRRLGGDACAERGPKVEWTVER